MRLGVTKRLAISGGGGPLIQGCARPSWGPLGLFGHCASAAFPEQPVRGTEMGDAELFLLLSKLGKVGAQGSTGSQLLRKK